MKLVGGKWDGKEVGNPNHPAVQMAEQRQGFDTILYHRETFFSSWPIPGWEMFEVEPDPSRESHPRIYWRCRNYFTSEQKKKVCEFMDREIYMSGVLKAYEYRESDFISRFEEAAIESAHDLALLTGFDERPERTEDE